MADHYIWQSSGGCEICDAMRGTYPSRPARPHPHCTCTIVEVSGDAGNGQPVCLNPHNAVLSLDSIGIDYSPEEGLPEEISIEYEAEVLCRDLSEITISIVVNYDGSKLDDLQNLSDIDSDAAEQGVEDEANAKAIEEADANCPVCPPKLS